MSQCDAARPEGMKRQDMPATPARLKSTAMPMASAGARPARMECRVRVGARRYGLITSAPGRDHAYLDQMSRRRSPTSDADRKGSVTVMRAIVFDPGAPRKFTFGEVPAPTPVSPNELLIEVKAISLNFGEVFGVDNAENPGDVPGWDSAGIVLVPAADGLGPPAGARVVGADWSKAWAQQRVLASDNVAIVPDAVDLETAAALCVAGVTALQIVRRLGSVVGRRVLITGASGGVGRLAVQLAARAGAHVIAAVGNSERGAGLRDLGADEVVVGLEGVDPVYGVLEHVGGPMLADAYSLLGDGGRVISVGAASGQPTTIDFEAERMTMSHKVIESFMTAWPVGRDLQFVVELAERGQLDAQIGYQDSWEHFNAAVDALLGRRVAGKVALTLS